MSPAPADFLARMRSIKDRRLAGLVADPEATDLPARARAAAPPRDFVGALRAAAGNAVIAEVKRSSPSLGAINPGADPATQARAYVAGGAAAVSVLTESEYFSGSPADLTAVRAAVDVPLLAKDFFSHPLELAEARLAGADAVLLMADFLPGDTLATLYREARDLGLAVLLELHDAAELPRVLALDPPLVGVNHRDLKTLTMNLDRAVRLRPRIPAGVLVVAESGIAGPADLSRLKQGGCNAYLVGGHLMSAPDPAAAVRELVAA
ncbi:MAG: indole-3-glycerol-phosphate synthase [Deltaproteobacteria bacterium]|nr:indole-3-glycerol-phosphate synthase [Deltaproteobacteria bacterium]